MLISSLPREDDLPLLQPRDIELYFILRYLEMAQVGADENNI